MKTMIVDKKGKQIPQEQLNDKTDEYKENYSPNQDYHLGYLHAKLKGEDREILASMMADGLFFGIYLANKYGYKIKQNKDSDEKADVTMYG